jgi:hypothetical protein
MVPDREGKSDVFAPFQLGGDVQDNEPTLLEEAIRVNAAPKGDIYAQFGLSDIVRENEQRLDEAKKREEAGTVAAAIGRDEANPIRKRAWKLVGLPKFAVKQKGEVAMDSKICKRANGGGAEASVTIDASVSAAAASAATAAGGGAGGGADGDAANSTDILGSHFYWHSPVDDIFADFNLSEIVRDYETLQRRVKYAPQREDYGDDGDNEEERYLKASRYSNAREWWLDNWPRCHGLIFRVLIPLWILTGIAMGLGFVLAELEEQAEYQRNDEVMQTRFRAEQFPLDEELRFLFGIPTSCLNVYLSRKGGSSPPNTRGGDDDFPAATLGEWLGESFPPVSPDFSDNINETMEEVERYMEVCEEVATDVVTRLLNYTSASSEVGHLLPDLTFDWIRW